MCRGHLVTTHISSSILAGNKNPRHAHVKVTSISFQPWKTFEGLSKVIIGRIEKIIN